MPLSWYRLVLPLRCWSYRPSGRRGARWPRLRLNPPGHFWAGYARRKTPFRPRFYGSKPLFSGFRRWNPGSPQRARQNRLLVVAVHGRHSSGWASWVRTSFRPSPGKTPPPISPFLRRIYRTPLQRRRYSPPPSSAYLQGSLMVSHLPSSGTCVPGRSWHLLSAPKSAPPSAQYID